MNSDVINHEPELANFLRTGQLGFLSLGMSLDDVISYLGTPDKKDTIDTIKAFIEKGRQIHDFFYLQYGLLEFAVATATHIVVGIQLDLRLEMHDALQRLKLNWLPMIRKMDRPKLKKFLNKHHIASLKEKSSFEGADELFWVIRIIPSNISIGIDFEMGIEEITNMSLFSGSPKMPTEEW